MCYSGCKAENRSGDCTLSKNFLCDGDDDPEDTRESEEIEPTEQEIADAEDKYFNKE